MRDLLELAAVASYGLRDPGEVSGTAGPEDVALGGEARGHRAPVTTTSHPGHSFFNSFMSAGRDPASLKAGTMISTRSPMVIEPGSGLVDGDIRSGVLEVIGIQLRVRSLCPPGATHAAGRALSSLDSLGHGPANDF